MVNEPLPLPSMPPWLDLVECEGCGALYQDHRGCYSWDDAVGRVRGIAVAAGDTGGGYRSRGPVLWALRVLKAESWLLAHCYCDPSQEQDEPIPF